MAHAANQPSGATYTPKGNLSDDTRSTTVKPRVKAPAKKPAKGKGPSKAAETHSGYTPAPVDPLMAGAQQQAAGIYAPQAQANASLQASVPTWFANYQAAAAAQAATQQAYNAPVLAQQNAAVTNLNAPAAGLDTSSAEYARSQQAGKGLSTLAQFSADNTQANLSTGQQYFAGQASNAARYLPEALTALKQQGGVIASQQAGKAQELYQGAKTQAVNADIAYKTLGVNSADKLADNSLQAQTAAQTAADRKAARVVSRKNTRDRLAASTTNQATAQAKADAKQAEKDAAAAGKKTASIQKAVGKVKNKVQDIQDKWAQGGTVEYTVQQTVDKKTGKPVGKDFAGPTKVVNVKKTRPIKRDELRGSLVAKYGEQLVSIMERRRAGQTLTPQQVEYLHNQDPDFRIPSDWRPKKKTGTARPKNAAAEGGYRPT